MAEYSSTGGQGYILKTIGHHFGLSLQRVKEDLHDEPTYATINSFLKGEERVPKLVFFYQTRDSYTDDGEFVEAAGARRASRVEAACSARALRRPVAFVQQPLVAPLESPLQPPPPP
jgi:hypothetical protein